MQHVDDKWLCESCHKSARVGSDGIIELYPCTNYLHKLAIRLKFATMLVNYRGAILSIAPLSVSI